MNQRVQIGLIQMQCTDDPELNLERAIKKIGDAASRGARVICLQELFRSLYFCQTEEVSRFDLAEEVPGPTTGALSRVAQDLEIIIVASLFEKRAEGLYHNTTVTLDEKGEIVGKYRKMHIPDDPLYYEKFYFTPGDLGFQVHETRQGKLGVLVCWDQWFPEAARLTALKGSHFLFYPTAIGWLDGESEEMNRAQHDAWETIQRSHAIANGVFVVSVNRVGKEGDLIFWGQSFVVDPFGRIIKKASSSDEETLVVECDLSQIDQTRRNWPFFRDRRIDAYGGLERRFIERDQS